MHVVGEKVSGNLYMHNTKTNHWDLLNEEIEGRFGLQKSVRSGFAEDRPNIEQPLARKVCDVRFVVRQKAENRAASWP